MLTGVGTVSTIINRTPWLKTAGSACMRAPGDPKSGLDFESKLDGRGGLFTHPAMPPGGGSACPYIHPMLPCWHCGRLWCLRLERARSQTCLCCGFTCDPKHLPPFHLSFPTYPPRILGILISKGPSRSVGLPALSICCLTFPASWLPKRLRRGRHTNVVLSGTLPFARPISGDKLWLARKVTPFSSRAYFFELSFSWMNRR